MFKILEIDTYTAERNRNGQVVHLPYVVVYRFERRSVNVRDSEKLYIGFGST